MKLAGIKKYIRSASAGATGEHDRGPLAHKIRDAKYLLGLTLLVLIMSSIFHYGYYISILEIKGQEDLSTYPDIKLDQLLKINAEYMERQAVFADLVSNRPMAIDPN